MNMTADSFSRVGQDDSTEELDAIARALKACYAKNRNQSLSNKLAAPNMVPFKKQGMTSLDHVADASSLFG